MHMGPDDVLLNLSLNLRSELSSDEIEAAIARIEGRIKSARPEITRVFIEANDQRTAGHTAGKARAARAAPWPAP